LHLSVHCSKAFLLHLSKQLSLLLVRKVADLIHWVQRRRSSHLFSLGAHLAYFTVELVDGFRAQPKCRQDATHEVRKLALIFQDVFGALNEDLFEFARVDRHVGKGRVDVVSHV
jgi:hypothetical protein